MLLAQLQERGESPSDEETNGVFNERISTVCKLLLLLLLLFAAVVVAAAAAAAAGVGAAW